MLAADLIWRFVYLFIFHRHLSDGGSNVFLYVFRSRNELIHNVQRVMMFAVTFGLLVSH